MTRKDFLPLLCILLLLLQSRWILPPASAATPGSSFDNAASITSGRYSFDMAGGGVHYFKIDVQAGQTLTALLQMPATADFNLAIYDSDQVLIGGPARPGKGVPERQNVVPSKSGFHYIVVQADSSSLGIYDLSVFITRFRAVAVGWGTLGSPVEAAQGDTGVPLTVTIRNEMEYSVSSLVGTLQLGKYFTNSTGGATASDYQSATLTSGQTAAFTFKVNIPSVTPLGSHTMNMTIGFQMVSGSKLIQGTPVDTQISITLLGRASIDASTSIQSLGPGSSNDVLLALKNVGTADASNIDVALSPQSGLTLVGSYATYSFAFIKAGGSVSIPLRIFVAQSLAGSSAQVTISLSYKDAYGASRTASRVIGFEVVGEIAVVNVVQASWGGLNNPVEVGPGDSGATLTVALQNVGQNTITGLRASLQLTPPFVNMTGGDTVTSFYSANLGSGQTATLQFLSSILPSAQVARYSLGLRLEYLVLSGNLVVRGAPLTLTFPVLLPGRAALAATYVASSVPLGSEGEVRIDLKNAGSATINGLEASLSFSTNAPLSLSVGDSVQRFGNLGPNQSVAYVVRVQVSASASPGLVQVQFTAAYRDSYGQVRSESRSIGISIRTPDPPQLYVAVSGSVLISGTSNRLTLTISNEGAVPISALTATVNLPTTTFSLFGESNQWYFPLLPSKARVTLTPAIVVTPGAADGTYQATLTLAYRDAYGVSRSETRSIGISTKTPDPPQLSISASGSTLTAGTMNRLTITITNEGTEPVNAFTSTLNLPATATFSLSGEDNQWFFPSIPPKSYVTITPAILVASGASEGPYSASIAMTYRDASGATRSDTRTVGMAVRRWISPISISLNDNTLTAGVINNRGIRITNTGATPIQSVMTTVSMPSASGGTTLVSLATGESRWFTESIPAKGNITISPQVFAAPASVDNVYVIQIEVSYEDSSGVPHTEARSISLAVQGLIFMQVQNVVTSPLRVAPGDNITIVGDLFNRGNVPARYTTVDIRGRTPNISGGTQYIGQVDTDIATPFSVTGQVDRRAQNGTYPITITVSYSDNYNKTRSISSSASVVVGGLQERRTVIQPTQQTLIGGLTPTGLVFFTIVAMIAIVTLAAFWRSRRTMRQKPSLVTSALRHVKSLESPGKGGRINA